LLKRLYAQYQSYFVCVWSNQAELQAFPQQPGSETKSTRHPVHRLERLTLGVGGCLASSFEAGFLAFLYAWITRQVAALA